MPMTSVEFRILVAGDAAAWRKVRLEALENDPEAFSATIEAHQKLTDDEILSRIVCDPSNKFVFGAFAGGELVGTAGFVREPGLKERHKGFVWGVYLRASHRGEGVGRRMMMLLLDHARKIEGLEQINISVATTQTAAMSLYRSLNFVPYGCEPRALKVNGRYIDEEHLWLRLS
jgi:RimJ/RimL family protein N-acetyltransferase